MKLIGRTSAEIDIYGIFEGRPWRLAVYFSLSLSRIVELFEAADAVLELREVDGAVDVPIFGTNTLSSLMHVIVTSGFRQQFLLQGNGL